VLDCSRLRGCCEGGEEHQPRQRPLVACSPLVGSYPPLEFVQAGKMGCVDAESL
jgi:hypothetical protein